MFISKVKYSKVMGVAFCNRGLLYFATGAVVFCDRPHAQRIGRACLRAVFSGADAALNQSGFFERIEVANHRRFVHLTFLRQRLQAGKARSAAFVVVIRQPIKHDLSGWFQPLLLHCQRRHVMAHGFSFRVVETPPAVLCCVQRIRFMRLPIPAVPPPLRLLGWVERLPVLPTPLLYSARPFRPSPIFAASLIRYQPSRKITSPSSSI